MDAATVQRRKGALGSRLEWLLATIAVAAIAIPLAVLLFAPKLQPHRPRIVTPQYVVPQTVVPQVEPVKFQDLSPDDARSFNATVPFVSGAIPPARPFHFAGTPDALARATDCLAAAVLYEAGDDAVGEQAVGQVILNRLRHPAFPKTVCGVVFQGSERSTGCQFTFTCDGALHRQWSDDAWKRAREVAGMALAGYVYKPVGLATHYHTDWVVPYWSSSLDKLAAVHTHLFYRWTGWWGTPPAFNRQVDPDEPVIPALAQWSDAHRMGGALAQADAATAEAVQASAMVATPMNGDPNSFLIALDPKMSADAFPVFAAKVCGDRDRCKFMGWTDKSKVPTTLSLDAKQVAGMSFSYLRDRSHNFEKALWNCGEFKRPDKGDCMKQQVLLAEQPATPVPAAPQSPAVIRASAVDPLPLTGVHRKGDAGVAPPPVLPTVAVKAPAPKGPAPKPSPTPAASPAEH
jgi:spore germination cell wall hydrolase CwlJ-like protein